MKIENWNKGLVVLIIVMFVSVTSSYGSRKFVGRSTESLVKKAECHTYYFFCEQSPCVGGVL
jgi:hypothetical protein